MTYDEVHVVRTTVFNFFSFHIHAVVVVVVVYHIVAVVVVVFTRPCFVFLPGYFVVVFYQAMLLLFEILLLFTIVYLL